MVIISIQYSIKQSIVALLALLTAPVELLTENKRLSLTAASPRIATVLNRSWSRWQWLGALISPPWKESPACS